MHSSAPFALTENANKPVQPLLQYAHRTTACHTICHISLRSVNIYFLKLDFSASTYFCGIIDTRLEMAVKLGWGLHRTLHSPAGRCWRCLWTACCWDCVTLTSPHGPGSRIHPVLRWCTVCRHIPGCCVGSGLRSSGTPDSSCPAGTCSTTHQPPSHQTLYHLKIWITRVTKEGLSDHDYKLVHSWKVVYTSKIWHQIRGCWLKYRFFSPQKTGWKLLLLCRLVNQSNSKTVLVSVCFKAALLAV